MSYADEVLADEPTLALPLDEVAPPFVDVVGGAVLYFNGAQHITPAQPPLVPDGGYSISVGGSSSADVTIDATPTPEGTMECVAQVDTLATPFLALTKDSSTRYFIMGVDAAGVPLLYSYTSGGFPASGGSPLSDGDVVHMAATWTAEGSRLYVNGEEVASLDVRPDLAWDKLRLSRVSGVGGFQSNRTAAAHDWVALYPHALSAARIAAHYAALVASSETEPQTIPFGFATPTAQAFTPAITPTPRQVAFGFSASQAQAHAFAPATTPGAVSFGLASSRAAAFSMQVTQSPQALAFGFAPSRAAAFSMQVTEAGALAFGFAPSQAQAHHFSVTPTGRALALGFAASAAQAHTFTVGTGVPPDAVGFGFASTRGVAFPLQVVQSPQAIAFGAAPAVALAHPLALAITRNLVPFGFAYSRGIAWGFPLSPVVAAHLSLQISPLVELHLDVLPHTSVTLSLN